MTPLLLAFGDSLTAGYGLQPDEAFPVRLEALLRARWPAARVINAGISGDTTAGGLARLPRLLSGLAARPDLAIVELGANDLLRGRPLAEVRRNLDAILHLLGQAGISVLVAGMRAPPFLGDFARRFDRIFPEVAAAHGAALYPFFLDGVVGDPALTLADGLHPNARAIDRVASAITPVVAATLDRAAAAA